MLQGHFWHMIRDDEFSFRCHDHICDRHGLSGFNERRTAIRECDYSQLRDNEIHRPR
jgi:hypothetical protein